MRGLIGAIRLIHGGLEPIEAVEMGIINKSFDNFERELISDIVMTRIPDTWKSGDVSNERKHDGKQIAKSSVDSQ